ncbi:hypothetical protein [Glaciimonas soli]|uniref:Uncharacterized protein n=1 Tax=Glaciimonas soli TaxID=2590999 RepID=A0A843YLQ9_9BURK|nr:hypothetical protein [Glaciimonas soli]MQR00809.1 hypothetical protein [Glaciimonas soli]
MNMLSRLDLFSLKELALRSAMIRQACSCNKTSLVGWESMPISMPETQLRQIGTLIDENEVEPTVKEYHPNGTHYASLEAPIAPRYFPYNRCIVSECIECGRCYLRYNEVGGYFFDQRIRALDPSLIVDAFLPESPAK